MRADLDVFFYRGSLEVSQDKPIVQAVARAYEQTVQAAPTFGGSAGWMDSAIMVDAGIPTAVFGPSGEGAHAALEWVDLSSVVTAARVMRAAILDFCGTV